MKKYLIPILFVLSLSAAFIPFGSRAQVSSSYARRLAPSTFAALGTPPNGSVRYCSNCQATSPCTSGGSGASATRVNGAWNCSSGGVGTGDAIGPASSTDNAIARFDGTGGKTLQNSSVTISDTGVIGLPNGTTAAPTLSFGGQGFYSEFGGVIYAIGSNRQIFWTDTGQRFGAQMRLQWSNTDNEGAGSADAGIAKARAGVIKSTDGTTGLGDFAGNGVILKATDGANCFRVTVDNAGVLSTASATCP